jgi:hypothetical protein
MNITLAEAVVDQLSLTRNSSFDDRVWSSFSEADWEKAFTWLDLSGLTLYLRDRLERQNSCDMVPGCVRERLDRCQAENRRRVLAMTEELKVLNAMFKSEAIEHLVLKGFSLCPDYCADPAIRTQYDHDFLIRSESVSRTAALFQAAGYRRKTSSDEHPIEYCRPDPTPGRRPELVGLYSPQLRRSIELHYRLWESAEEKIEIDLARDLFEHAATRRWNEIEYMGLGDEDALVFQVLHAFRHILRNWCRLSVFLEIAHFLNRRSADTSFWIRFAHRINELRWVPEATMVVFSLAETLFSAPIPEAIKGQLTSARYPVLALWTERYGRSSALSNFRNDKYSLFLHREFVQDSVTWAGIRKRRLFPLQRPHRLPAPFHRRSSRLAKLWMDGCHAIRRVKFHAVSVFKYAWEHPRWMRLRHRGQALTARYAQAQSAPGDSSWNC